MTPSNRAARNRAIARSKHCAVTPLWRQGIRADRAIGNRAIARSLRGGDNPVENAHTPLAPRPVDNRATAQRTPLKGNPPTARSAAPQRPTNNQEQP